MEWPEFTGIDIDAVMGADPKDLSMPNFTANAKSNWFLVVRLCWLFSNFFTLKVY